MKKLALLIEENSQACFYSKHFGVECPGCGFQRSLVHLLRGEVIESLKMYPALLPTIIMVVFLLAHITFKINHGAKILLMLFGLNTILIAGSYILKLIN